MFLSPFVREKEKVESVHTPGERGWPGVYESVKGEGGG